MPIAFIATRRGQYNSALLSAVKAGDNSVLRAIIIGGTHPDTLLQCEMEDSRMGWGKIGKATPLYFASLFGYTDLVETLIELGAKVDAEGIQDGINDGATALYAAAVKGHDAVAELLLQVGADANFPERVHGETLTPDNSLMGRPYKHGEEATEQWSHREQAQHRRSYPTDGSSGRRIFRTCQDIVSRGGRRQPWIHRGW